MLQEALITFLFRTLDTTFSKTLSFLLQSLIWTIWILPFGTQKKFVLKNCIVKLVRPPQVMPIFIKVLDLSQDCANEWVIKIMMMNCFCGMVDQRMALSFISSRDHCQKSSPSRISETPQAGFEPAHNLVQALLKEVVQ